MDKTKLIKSLRQDISKYKKLRSKSFSIKTYTKMEEINNRADELLDKLAKNKILISAEDIKTWADYVNIFGNFQKDELLNLLQKKADFDIKQYLEEANKTLWEKINPKSKDVKYLSSNKLRKKSERYRSLHKKIWLTMFFRQSREKEIERLKNEASAYADAIVKDKIILKPEDYQATMNYISVICHPAEETEEEAKQKIRTLIKGNTSIQNQPQPSKTQSNRFRFGNKVKIAALTTLTFLGSVFGIKSGCSSENTTSNHQENISVQKQDTAQTYAPEVHWQKVSNLSSSKTSEQEISKQSIWNRYYDNTIEILSSKTKKEKLYQQIEQQIAKGIFSLPQDISKEKMAYSYVIYKEYGLSSSLSKALNSSEKLSEAAQQKLIKDIKAVGNKGEGAKQMALKKNHGKLSTFSKFNHAPKHLQKKHINNLKDLMKLKKQSNEK